MPESRICLGNAFLSYMGSGGGGKRGTFFNWVREATEGDCGDFLEIWGPNPGFWCIIKFQLTSILAESV